REARHRVVRQIGIQRRVGRVLVVSEQQRISVWRRIRGQLPGDHARCARTVIHHDLLLEHLCQAGAENARQEIGRAALRGRRDQADRPARIVLLRERLRPGGETQEYEKQTKSARHQSGRAPDSRMILSYFRISALKNASNCSMLFPTVSRPCSARRSLTSARLSTLDISLFSFAMTAFGVAAGT